MSSNSLEGRRVLVPGGTGTVGQGVVRAYLTAGAEVVVPTRTAGRAAEFRESIGATDRVHLVVHDYTTFGGAEELAAEMERRLGGIDDVVAPIGGWWAGTPLWEISESDWRTAFTGLATTHMAVLRAALPRMTAQGAYTVIVGDSASTPVPGSGLVSMEQAAVLMMQRVAQAEQAERRRIFALVLGPVGSGITAGQVGDVSVAISAATVGGRMIHVGDQAEFSATRALLAR